MPLRELHDATPSNQDGDGVSIVREAGLRPRLATAAAVFAVAASIGLAWWLTAPQATAPSARGNASVAPTSVTLPIDTAPAPARDRPASTAPASRRVAASEPLEATQGPDDMPSTDPNDLASHFAPGDPEPTAAEVIEALQASGDRTGLGAFNPPGTSPPLAGLAVPEDFVLPEGYVRHHQVTDEGEPLEPILMFSPDYVFRDSAGHEIAIPDDRVVPPELAPPGLPIRPITIPKH